VLSSTALTGLLAGLLLGVPTTLLVRRERARTRRVLAALATCRSMLRSREAELERGSLASATRSLQADTDPRAAILRAAQARRAAPPYLAQAHVAVDDRLAAIPRCPGRQNA
jgi:hypothetical protein